VIYALLGDTDNGKASVDVYVDTKLFKSTTFETHGAARASLTHAGFANIASDNKWVPLIYSRTYQATVVIQVEPIRQLQLTEGLWLDVVRVPDGYGFRFTMHEGKKSVDPILEIFTLDLFAVQAIGTWNAIEAALNAGLSFFKKVQDLVGNDVLNTLLEIAKEREKCQTSRRRTAMGRLAKPRRRSPPSTPTSTSLSS